MKNTVRTKSGPRRGYDWSANSKHTSKRQQPEATRRRFESRGEEPPDLSKKTEVVAPFAKYDERGFVTWNEELIKRMQELSKKEG